MINFQINLIKKIFLTALFLVTICFVVAVLNKANAQSFTFSPSSGSITQGTSTNIQIIVNSPPTGTNVVALRVSVPAGFAVQNFVTGPKLPTIIPCIGTNGFTSSQICIDAGVGSASVTLANGDVVGIITLQGVTAGSGTLALGTGSAISTGTQSYPLTAVSGVFTVPAGGGPGTLPNTSKSSRGTNSIIITFLGVILIGLGSSLYIRSNKKTNG